MVPIHVIGIDAALANMGLCRATIDWGAHPAYRVRVHTLRLVTTKIQDKKVVRKASDDLRRAKVLHQALQEFCVPVFEPSFLAAPKVAFAEIPSGSQSSTAARGLGIAVGVIASCPVPVIEVSQLEVKMASVGVRSASKADMISWAVRTYPTAPWLRHNNKITAANEHLADAIAVIHAGINTKEWASLMGLYAEAPTAVRRRPVTK